MRDPRRLFTDRQARYLSERSGGRCEACGCDLPGGWHAHHIRGHGDGGRTVVSNGMALCKSCHEGVHAMDGGGKFEPREWQREAFAEFEHKVLNLGGKWFVLEACPGAGKTAFAAWVGNALLTDDRYIERFNGIEHIVVVVPTTAVRGCPSGADRPADGVCDDFERQGLRVQTQFLYEMRGVQPPPRHKEVTVVTYSAASNAEVLNVIQTWRRQHGDFRFALILDEVHHTRTTGGSWGPAMKALADLAEFVMVMSGTYFRTDGHQIEFLDYANGRPVTDYDYPYSRGVKDRCVRPVAFRRRDARFDLTDDRRDLLVSECDTDELVNAAKREILRADSPAVEAMCREAVADLQRTRTRFPNAGYLFVCQPGRSADDEDRHVFQIADLVQRLSGDAPTVLTHHDPEDVQEDKLARYKHGSSPYLVAVNKVSEGCNIPRLRGVVFCRYTDSEMLFRQIVGRVVRTTKDDDGTAATAYLINFPVMNRFAENMHGEALQGLKALECKACNSYPCTCECGACGMPRRECDCPRETPAASLFAEPELQVVNVRDEAAGGVHNGSEVGEEFVRNAELLAKTYESFHHLNKVQIGLAMQFQALRSGGTATGPRPAVAANLDRQGVERRINRTVRRIAGTPLYRDIPADQRYAKAWTCEFASRYGVTFTQAKQEWSTERLEKAAEHLESRFKEVSRGR